MTVNELRQMWLRRRAAAIAGQRGWAASTDAYGRLLRLGPGRPSDHTRYGLALQEAGKADESLAAFRRATRLHPTSANAHRQLGLSLLRRGRNVEAAAALIRALALSPGDAATLQDLRALHINAPIPLADAVRAFRYAEDPPLGPVADKASPGLKRRARAAFAARDWQTAIRLYERIAEASPRQANAHLQLAHALKETGDFDRAETAYWRALAIQPRSPEIHLQIGHLNKERGGSDAKAAALAAWRLQPGNPAVTAELEGQGFSYRSLMEGRDDEARTPLQPGSADGLVERRHLQPPEDLGRRERALWSDLARLMAREN